MQESFFSVSFTGVLLQDMFENVKTIVGCIFLSKKMLQLPATTMKAFGVVDTPCDGYQLPECLM